MEQLFLVFVIGLALNVLVWIAGAFALQLYFEFLRKPKRAWAGPRHAKPKKNNKFFEELFRNIRVIRNVIR
jgi:hypothetical protein